jgi:hypothetical protein
VARPPRAPQLLVAEKDGKPRLGPWSPKIMQVDQIYDGCLTGKHRRTPFPEKVKYRSKRVLEIVHGDICGPITPTTPGGEEDVPAIGR